MPTATPLGPQFLINATLAVAESPAPVAVLYDTGPDAGAFVVTWQSFEDTLDSNGYGIYAKLYHADGSYVDRNSNGLDDDAFLVNTITAGNQLQPTVASDHQGNFMIAWQGEDRTNGGYDIYYRTGTFTDGLSTGIETVVNSLTGSQTAPAIAMDHSGNFVIAWQGANPTDATLGQEIYARQGTLSGGLGASEFQVNDTLAGDQTNPTVAMAGVTNSLFVIGWQSAVGSGEEASVEIFAKLYNPDGTPILPGSTPVGEFQVNALTSQDQVNPCSALYYDAGTGKYDAIVAWESAGTQGTGTDIRAGFFTGDGTITSTDLLVNQTQSGQQRSPAVAVAENTGHFLITWQSNPQDGYSWGLYGRSFQNPTTAGSEFQINDQIQMGPQTSAALAMTATGSTVVTWVGPDVPSHGEEVVEEGDGGHKPAVHARLFNDAGVSPVGSEFVVNLVSGLEERPSATASDFDGNFVVVWESWEDTGDGSSLGIYGRRFFANGTPNGDAFLINTTTAGNQGAPVIAMDRNGNFVVVWESDQGGTGTTGYDIYARRYDATGKPTSGEILVNTTTTDAQRAPAIAMDADGNYVVVWESTDGDGQGIYGQRFLANGTANGGEFLVNTLTQLDQVSPTVAMNAAGEFVVGWVSDYRATFDPNDTEKSIFVRWYNANGVAPAKEFLVHKYVKDAQEYPSVAIAKNGNFVVVWQSINQERLAEGLGSSWGVYARQFRPDGSSPQEQEFRVNETTDGPQRYPSVGMDDVGNFVVAWQTNKQDGSSWGIYQRAYRANGTPIGGEELVNTWTSGPQILANVSITPAGDYGIFWTGQGPGHVDGINGRLFAGPTVQHLYAVGTEVGAAPNVLAYDADTGALKYSFWAYAPTFLGGVRVATGDVNGDGTDDIITGVASGAGPHVKVFNGATGAEMYSFWAFAPTFQGGINVAAGDINGDGYADIIVGAGSGAGPHVRAFSGVNLAELSSFWAYAPTFLGGVTVAAGDVNGDGRDDIITGVASGAGPHVKVFNGPTSTEIASFWAFAPTFQGGINVASGDTNGDGHAEIIVGVASGAGPHVKVFDGATTAETASFWAFSPTHTGGVRVSTSDRTGDHRADLILGTGPGSSGMIRILDGLTLADLDSFFAFGPAFTAGLAVGGSGK